MKCYLNIKSGNLKHYIESGIILPSFFYENRFEDVQSKIGDCIFLSKEAKYINDSDMIIQLEINENQVERLDESFYISKYPISLSKITDIVTKKDNQRLKIIIENSDIGFVENLYSDTKNRENIIFSNLHEFNRYNDEMKLKIKKYNAFLGGYALLKLKAYKVDFKNLDGDLFDIFLYGLDEDTIIKKTEEKGISYKRKLGLFKYEELEDKNDNIYLLMILYNYFNKKKIETFIDDFLKDKIDENLSDEFKTKLLFYYGYLTGYKKLKSKYFDKEVKFYYKKEQEIFDKVYNFVFDNKEVEQDIFEESDKFIEEISNIKEFSLDSILKLPQRFKIILKNLKNHYLKLSKKNKELEKEISKLREENNLLKQSEDNFIKISLNNLDRFSQSDLKVIVKQKGIKNYSNKSKEELIEMIKKGLL